MKKEGLVCLEEIDGLGDLLKKRVMEMKEERRRFDDI